MSIYCTLWEIMVPRRFEFDDEFVKVFAQGVPPHIGHPRHYPEGDPYGDFLPPVVEYEESLDAVPAASSYRAVVIVQQGRDEKDCQKYVDPLLVLTGKEYASLSFDELLNRIYEAMRWDTDVCGYKLLPDGKKQWLRKSEMQAKLVYRPIIVDGPKPT